MPSVYEKVDSYVCLPQEDGYYDWTSRHEPSGYALPSVGAQTVRVVLGTLGPVARASAPDLDIVVDGSSAEDALRKFLDEIRKRDYGAWLMFDVGPTRPEEIAEGLNAPEDEDWSEPVESPEE
jgi:hypothetical protein